MTNFAKQSGRESVVRQLSLRRGNKSTWVIVVVVLLLVIGLPICICGGCIGAGLWGVNSAITGSEPYKHGLAAAKANPDVIDQLGEPIEAGLLFTGSIKFENDQGECDITVPISGPKGNGTLIVRATRTGGRWDYQELKTQIGNNTVDLRSPTVFSQ